MLTTTILISGGLVVAGTRILLRRRQARTPVWLTQSDGSRVKSYAIVVETKEMNEKALERTLNTSYTLSTVSLGLNMLGKLVFAPIGSLVLPIDVYTFGILLEQGYDHRFGPRRGAQLTTISIFVLTFTLSNELVLVTLIQWAYFFYRTTAFDLEKRRVRLEYVPA